MVILELVTPIVFLNRKSDCPAVWAATAWKFGTAVLFRWTSTSYSLEVTVFAWEPFDEERKVVFEYFSLHTIPCLFVKEST